MYHAHNHTAVGLDVRINQLDEEEESEVKAEATSCSVFASAPAGIPRTSSARFSREMLQRRLKKRARAWRVFLAVMQVGGTCGVIC